jgi:hypothetical protein
MEAGVGSLRRQGRLGGVIEAEPEQGEAGIIGPNLQGGIKSGCRLITEEARRKKAVLVNLGLNLPEGGKDFRQGGSRYNSDRVFEGQPVSGFRVMNDNRVCHRHFP